MSSFYIPCLPLLAPQWGGHDWRLVIGHPMQRCIKCGSFRGIH